MYIGTDLPLNYGVPFEYEFFCKKNLRKFVFFEFKTLIIILNNFYKHIFCSKLTKNSQKSLIFLVDQLDYIPLRHGPLWDNNLKIEKRESSLTVASKQKF